MRINNIQALFENYTLQTKEEIILGTIINCKNTIKNLGLVKPKDFQSNDNFVTLFESVSGINVNNTQQFFDVDSVLQIEDYHNNPFAYLTDVKQLMENYIPVYSTLSENDEIKVFTDSVSGYIKQLELVNDFQKYEAQHELILKTKIFAKQPINVLGVNLFEIEKLKDTLGFRLLYSIIYNKTFKQMLFIGDGIILAYDIRTDQLGEHHEINKDFAPLKVKPTNYLDIIKNEISNNLFEIYTDRTTIKPLKFTDNLFGDVARLNIIEQIKVQNKKNSSVIR